MPTWLLITSILIIVAFFVTVIWGYCHDRLVGVIIPLAPSALPVVA